MLDNETYIHRTEATGGALVFVFEELHGGCARADCDWMNRIPPRWVFRVVCECCHDLHTGPDFDAALSRAGRHAGLCTEVPQRLRTTELAGAAR